ncbi:hypothetical protein FRC11_008864 [Ceratobasidium sp. 423]|nr:hypothetical protein FRC11_008864 [Ceratobasidium sp. 423]
MADFVYAYFLHREELIDIYTRAGGNIGTFNVEDFNDIQHARRAIFQYLLPGFMHVWYAVLDGRDGMVFFVGEPDCSLREAVNRDLAKRCYSVFGRPPDPCNLVDDVGDVKYDLTTRDGTVHRLRLLEFMQSDRHGDRYPLLWQNIPPDQRHLMQ